MNKKQRTLYATSVSAFTAALLTSLAVLPLVAQSGRTKTTATRAHATESSVAINDAEIDTLALRAHTRFLSDDLLRGRDTGSEGEHIAAAYIESQLIALGAQPLGAQPLGAQRPGNADPYMLPVPLRSAQISDASRMVLRGSGDSSIVTYGRTGFILNTGGVHSFRRFSGDVVYAGQAASALALLRNADIRGDIVAFNGSLGAAASAIIPLLISKGAAGVFVLVADAANYNLYVRSRGESRFFADASVDDPVWQPDIPVAIVGPSAIRTLFAGAADAAGATTLTSVVPLRINADVDVAYKVRDVSAANVAGIIRGSDPRRANDVIVYTAHYDHLGVGEPSDRGDSIYNGFSDNAAGCAMLLAIAEAVRAHPPAYSVAFLFFTGEERGLLGSSYMAAYPPIPLASIKGLINLDAGAPPIPPVSWRLAGGSEVPAVGALAVQVAKSARSVTSLSGASPNSDYWPFLHRGVPAVFIIPGNEWLNTTAAQRDSLMKKWDHYHDPADEYHPDFPFAGVARYAAYALALGRAIARQ